MKMFLNIMCFFNHYLIPHYFVVLYTFIDNLKLLQIFLFQYCIKKFQINNHIEKYFFESVVGLCFLESSRVNTNPSLFISSVVHLLVAVTFFDCVVDGLKIGNNTLFRPNLILLNKG